MVANPPVTDLRISFYTPSGDGKYKFYGGSTEPEYAWLLEAKDKGVTAKALLEQVGSNEGAALKLIGELTANRVVNTQATDEIIGGTFTATNATMVLELRVGIGSYGSAKPAFLLAVGFKDPPGGRIMQRKVLAPAEPGVTEYKVEFILLGSADRQQTLVNRMHLTNLTPGRVYTFQVTGGTISSSKSNDIGRNPIQGDFSPDMNEFWTASLTDKIAYCVVVGGRPFWSFNSVLTTGGVPYADVTNSSKWINTPVAIPTGDALFPIWIACGESRVAVVNTNFANASSVTVINRLTRLVEGSVALPDPVVANGVAINPASTIAYVTAIGGKVYPLTLATRVFGAALAGFANPQQPQVTSDGLRLWVPDGDNVYPVPLPAFTFPAPIALGANTFPEGTALGPDNSLWCCLIGTAHAGRIVQVKSDLNIGVTVVTRNENNLPGLGAKSCGVSSPKSGQPPIIYWHNGLRIGYSYTDDGAEFDSVFPFGTSIGGTAVSKEEYVFNCYDTGSVGKVQSWSAADVNIQPLAVLPDNAGQFLELWAGRENIV